MAATLVMATTCQAASQITTTTANGHYSASHFYTHFANGHYWTAVDENDLAVLYSSPDGVTWASQGTIFPFTFPVDTNYFATRYRASRIFAVAFNQADNTRYYREGSLAADGSVSWSAAPAAAGAADPADPDLNILVTGGRPVVWRAGLNGNGAFWRGSALTSPSWAALSGVVPAHGLTSGFTAGAIFTTGGADPNDLIVLRAFTQSLYAAGQHRLLALKWNDALGAYDGSWYNVSTLGGTLTEDTTTEVQPHTDVEIQRQFTAVADSSGNLHALYMNRAARVTHYRKAVGFNNAWTRVSSDVIGAGAAKISLSAAANGALVLFYEKNAAQRDVWYRRFDGTSWGPEILAYPGSVLATDLRRALAPLEFVVSCTAAFGFTTGSSPPFGVSFSLAGACYNLTTSAAGSQITVETPDVKMVWDAAGPGGGGLNALYGKSEANPGVSRVGDTSSYNLFATQINDVNTGSTWHFEGYDVVGGNRAGRMELLEASRVRVRLRQAYDYTPTIHLARDWSVYGQPRLAIDESLVVDTTQDLRGAQGLHPQGTAACGGTFYCAGLSDAANRVWVATDDATAYSDVLGIAYSSPFLGRAGTSPSWNNLFEAGTPNTWLARVHEGSAISTPAGTDTRYYLVYPYLAGLTSGGSEWQPYASDYRTPSGIALLAGARWWETAQHTGGGDDFNEAEVAYALTLHPVDGLRFRIDGTVANPRRRPFFKLRQWRALFALPSVTLDGTPLIPALDYTADVKPVSRAHLAQNLRWHSTLQDSAAVTSPDVGGAGQVVGAPSFVAARYGSGVSISASTQYVALPTSDFNPARGALEFWFRPAFNSADGVHHDICGFSDGLGHVFVLEKSAANNLNFVILVGGTVSQLRIAPVNYSWRTGDWVHLRLEWDDSLPLATQMRLFLNGVEPVHTDPVAGYNSAGLTVQPLFRFGNIDGDATYAPGVFDEIHLYGGSSTTPAPLAYGGLLSDSREYFARTDLNGTLGFTAVDGIRRGVYLYVGADSTFHGLNIALQTAGTWATAGDLVWEFWNGTAWATLESGYGFADDTNHLTRNGNIYWTGDPSGWAPYSVNGGTDLYYVRAHLAAGGAYAMAPVEREIRTDILLFQYCGDITAAGQEFAFAAPTPTAVTLQSFGAIPRDSAVDLEWRTSSELDNLGFHLYRSAGEEGPWQRITPSLIPGLGSSPVGAVYSWRDAGLQNGTRYFYRLEDVDTASLSTFHGPVSAMPQADAGGGSGSGDPGNDPLPDAAAGSARAPLPACTSPVSELPCVERYGDPDSVSVRELVRDRRFVELELLTGGFEVVREADGRVWVRIAGFEDAEDPHGPALPWKRVMVEAPVGKRARLSRVRETGIESFRGVAPSAAGFREMEVRSDATVRAGRRAVRLRRGRGLLPRQAAQLGDTVFVGESKQLPLSMFPVRYDGRVGAVQLARRIRVRVDFAGRESGETGSGSRGRRGARKTAATGETLGFLHTSGPGLYGVSFEQLLPGRRRGIALDLLSVQHQGEEVPYHVEPDGPVFGPGSALFLYAPQGPPSTSYGGELVYEVLRQSGGRRMGTVAVSPQGEPIATASLGITKQETNRFYLSGLLEAADPWLWENMVGGVSKTKSFELGGVDPSASRPGRVRVYLQGGSDAEGVVDHHVDVFVNGAWIGETWFAGKVSHSLELEVPAGLFGEGSNELTLRNAGDTGVYSLVFLDRFEVEYPQLSSTRGGVFEGEWSERGLVRVALSGGAVAGLDVTEGADPRWLLGLKRDVTAVSLQAEAGHRYLLVGVEGLKSPGVSAPVTTSLTSAQNQADYIVITPAAFVPAAQQLAQRRSGQGLSVKVATLEEITSAFGHGEASGEALREFLRFAYQQWARPSVSYVVLLGDSSFDPRKYISSSWESPLPALFLKTSYLVTASDPTLAAVNGEDLVPDLAIGRLPAQTLEQAEAMVHKLIAWEESGQGLGGKALLVADNPDEAGDFEADIEDIRESYLADRATETIFLRREGSATRSKILEAMDGGVSTVSYAGHGGVAVWASENVLNSWDVSSLRAQSTQGVMLTLNCLNGYFVAPSFDSMAEAYLKAEGRGTIAAISPSGLSVDGPAHQLHRLLMGELMSGPHERLGDAVLAAQQAYARAGLMPELLSVYHLFGDPATRIRP